MQLYSVGFKAFHVISGHYYLIEIIYEKGWFFRAFSILDSYGIIEMSWNGKFVLDILLFSPYNE